MKTTHAMIKRFLLIGTVAMSLNVQAQASGTPIAPPTDLIQKVDLAGTYVYESNGLTFWLNVNHDSVSYPVDDGNMNDVCGVNATGQYCKPIAISPPRPYDPNRYIAHLQASDCWGTTVAFTRDISQSKAKTSDRLLGQKGKISFNSFSIFDNVGIIPAEPQVVACTFNNDTVAVEDPTSASGSATGASNVVVSQQCAQAKKAAALLEKAKAFRVSKSGLNLQLRKGRILRLKRVDLMPLPM